MREHRARRWRPKTGVSVDTLPTAHQWCFVASQADALLPVPPVKLSVGPTSSSKSHRCRARHLRRLEVMHDANRKLYALNTLHSGHCRRRTDLQRWSSMARTSISTTLGQRQAQNVALRESHRLCIERRGSRLTSAETVAKLIKHDKIDRYGSVRKKMGKQAVLVAALVDEPTDERVVEMLEVLSAEEAAYYASEDNVIESSGKSQIIFEEIEQRYGFLGGSLEEYLEYFQRPDLPKGLWDFTTGEHVKAVAGFSVVEKKNGRQRKLLMQCSANYLFSDVRRRENHGIFGGASLAALHVPSDDVAVASCDQSNAFTSIQTPEWMWAYSAVPPVRAMHIWDRLDPEVQRCCHGGSWIYPRYRRLAMGGSHSVHIIMNINVTTVGKILTGSSKFFKSTAVPECESDEDGERLLSKWRPKDARGVFAAESDPDNITFPSCVPLHKPDEDWSSPQTTPPDEPHTMSPSEWLTHLRRIRMETGRAFSVLHLFGGARRNGDVQDFITKMAVVSLLTVFIMTVDLETDSRWNLACSSVFDIVMTAIEEGLVDVIIGGPPCSTWSVARWLGGGGPRPLRLRGKYEWGISSLRAHEKARVREANVLLVNTLTAMESVTLRGGRHLLEHPADPGLFPYASIWDLEVTKAFQKRTSSILRLLHQCMTGQCCRKATGISSDLEGSECFDLVCDRSHVHTFVGGKSKGKFATAQLQTYTARMCEMIATCVISSLKVMEASGTGPTGFIRGEDKLARVSSWTTYTSEHPDFAVAVLNEESVHGRYNSIVGKQLGIYYHVDDGVFLGEGAEKPLVNETMHKCANGLEEVGFSVSDRTEAHDVDKILGYSVQRRPARVFYPSEKGILLESALRHLVGLAWVDTGVLRSILAIWVWGALLRRDLLCIPHAIFRFVIRGDGRVLHWWPSARSEAKLMAAVVGYMYADIGAPLSNVLFASDAMGSDDASVADDKGGWGLVAADISNELARECLLVGMRPGLSVCRLSGDVTGPRRPDLPLKRRVPFTKLPKELFEACTVWHDVAAGRWRYADHITLGEMRSIVILSRILGSCASAHRTKYMALEDNRACSGASTKGRSSSPLLNFLLRQRAATLLAADILLLLPWVETSLQPADELSRVQDVCWEENGPNRDRSSSSI